MRYNLLCLSRISSHPTQTLYIVGSMNCSSSMLSLFSCESVAFVQKNPANAVQLPEYAIVVVEFVMTVVLRVVVVETLVAYAGIVA